MFTIKGVSKSRLESRGSEDTNHISKRCTLSSDESKYSPKTDIIEVIPILSATKGQQTSDIRQNLTKINKKHDEWI